MPAYFPKSIVTLFLLVAASPLAASESGDERFVAGLRERRLFQLAESYCLRRIAEPELGPRERAQLAIELARTYGEHAVQSPPGTRPALWKKSHSVVADYAGALPESPWLLLVQLQDALTWLARGELARQEAQVVADREQLYTAARDHLRQAIRILEQVDRQLEVALRRTTRSGSDDDAPSQSELEALEKNIAFQRARAYRNQGQCYPVASADRANSLTQAIEQLGSLAELAVADQIVWRARIDRVVCYRLLGDERRATQALAALIEAKPPAEIVLRALAEKIRLLLAAGRLAEAVEAIQQGRTADGHVSADLDFAHLEVQVAAWKAAAEAKDQDQIAAWQRRATAQVRRIEQEHGPYWMRRAETLLASSVTGNVGGDVATLVRAAESFYRGGQMADALTTYDRAVAEALAAGDAKGAFDLAFTAATIEHDRQRHQEAMARYRKLALDNPSQSRAGEAHLLAILNLAAMVRTADEAAQPSLLKSYQELLEEHLAHWPDLPTADQARWWLGNLRRASRDWIGAITAYRAISTDHEQHEPAVRAVAHCYLRWFAELKASGKPRDNRAGQAADYFERLVVGPQRQWPERWSPLDRDCAIVAAKIRLEHTDSGEQAAEQILAAALQGAADAPDAWKSQAQTLLVYSLAAQGRLKAAGAVMEQISAGSLDGLLAMLVALDQLAQAAEPQVASQLAELELRAAGLLAARSGELDARSLRTLETVHAAALARAGEEAAARDAYQKLAERYPQDGRVHEALAQLLLKGDDRQTLQAALTKWREVERKSRRGTERWYRARYSQAEAMHRLGENEKSVKLIKLTQVLYPELGGQAMKARFEKLLAECQP